MALVDIFKIREKVFLLKVINTDKLKQSGVEFK